MIISVKPLVAKQGGSSFPHRPKKTTQSKAHIPDNSSSLPPINSSRSTNPSSTKRATVIKPQKVSVKAMHDGVNSKPTVLSNTKKLSIIEEAEELLKAAPQNTPGACGSITVRFNHYNKSFPVYNGVVKWQDIDDEYCISFVYRGNYKRDIVSEVVYDFTSPYSNAARRDDVGMYFLGIEAGTGYRLLLEEDPQAGIGAEGMRIHEGPIKANSVQQSPMLKGRAGSCPLKSGNAAVNDITQTLRSMKASDLQSDEAKQLRELRDLEDVLFS
jgi:hypothetical protein